jgi:type I restriction enzyme, S subunit
VSTLNGDLLPCGWAIAPLSDIAEINPRGPDRLPNDDDLVSFIPMAAVEPMSGRLNSHDLREWKTVKKGFTRFQEGDVLIAKITPCMENGKVALASRLHAGVGAGSTEFHVLRPTGAAEAKFLMYYALQEQFRKDSRAKMTGTAGQLRVPASFVEERVLEVPPLPEQRRIVGAIESYSTKLDVAVAALERVRANLKRYRASVLKAGVEGRLVPTEAGLAREEGREFEPASVLLDRILAERRHRWEGSELARMKAAGKPPKDDRWKSKYKEPVAPDTSTLTQLPAGWCWATLDARASVLGGVTKGQKRKPTEKLRRVPYLRVANVQRGYFDLSVIKEIEATMGEIEELRLQSGDVLFNEGGDRDKLGRGWVWNNEVPECIHQNHVFRARIYTQDLLPKLLSWYGNSSAQLFFLQEGKQTTNLASLNSTNLKKLPVPVPPLAEQKRIVAQIELSLSVVDATATTTDASIARSNRLRQSILKWAFEGRLVDQDPNDEPASVLLDRIRAERATFTAATKSRRTSAHQIEAAK